MTLAMTSRGADESTLLVQDESLVNPATVYLASLGSDLSRRTMITSLNRAAEVINPLLSGADAWSGIPWQRITAGIVRAVIAKLSGSPATRNKDLAALKGVARSAWELRQCDTDELLRIKSIKGVCGSREIAGRYIPAGEITSLLLACARDQSPAGRRDAAMLAIAITTGARRAELASMDLTRCVEITGEARWEIRLIGKGDKERTVFASGNAARFLADWLSMRIAPGCNQGPLFCAVRKGGAIRPTSGLSTTALDKILKKRAAEAGVHSVRYHDFRRTTASNLLDCGADISVVAGILGHANVQTTARYDRRGERAKVKATELLSVPYFGSDDFRHSRVRRTTAPNR